MSPARSLCSRCGARASAALSHIPQLLECASDFYRAASASTSASAAAAYSGKRLSRAVIGGRRCSTRTRQRPRALKHDSPKCHFCARALVRCRRAPNAAADLFAVALRHRIRPPPASASADAAAAHLPAARLAALEHHSCDATTRSACGRSRLQSHSLCAVICAPGVAAVRASGHQQRPTQARLQSRRRAGTRSRHLRFQLVRRTSTRRPQAHRLRQQQPCALRATGGRIHIQC